MIKELKEELYTKIDEISAFEDRQFSIIDLDDMKNKLDLQEGAGVGIAFGGIQPTPRSHPAKSRSVSSAMMIDITFHVIVSYWYDSDDSEDNKVKAFDILDSIRSKVMGTTSVEACRGWEFVTEAPLSHDGDDSTIFYMQTWKVRSSQSSEQ